MTTAPATDQRRLLDVQALDTRLAQLAHQRRALPAIAAIAELQGRLEDLGRVDVDVRTRISDLRREVTKAETDVEQVRSRAQRDQARLDSGAVSAKDAQALTSELTSLARRQGELEDVEIEVMERLEVAEGELAAVTEQAEALRNDVARLEAERDAAFADLDAQAEQVRGQRAVAVDGIDEALLALYEKVRTQTGGLAVLALRGQRTEPLAIDLSLTELAEIKAAAPDAVVRSEEYGYLLVRLAPGE